jgi:uncharacterized protein (UPF0332 family)
MNSVWIKKYIEKSKSCLQEAESCLASGLHRAAIARAYYSLYQASNAWMDFQGYHRTDSTRLNWHHNEVNKNWQKILEDLGIDEFGADSIYNAAQDFRVRIEYQVGPEPSPKDAAACVDDCKRAVSWPLAALKKGGHG